MAHGRVRDDIEDHEMKKQKTGCYQINHIKKD